MTFTFNDDDEPETEHMTSWDSDTDLAQDRQRTASDPGRALLLALANYIDMHDRTNRSDPMLVLALNELNLAIKGLDWSVIGFATKAIANGEDLYSSFPNNEVLIKYNATRQSDDDHIPF